MIRPYPDCLMVEFVDPGILQSASLGLIKYSDSILFSGERDFELAVWEYPHEVILPHEPDLDLLIDRIVTCTRFCWDKFGKHNVMCFPQQAIGQYKHCANNSVFFRNPAHAMMFKMKFN